jgi:hypothetical protein
MSYDDSDEKDEAVRFGRSQKFRLTPKGSEAAGTYSSMIETARAGTGRTEFEAARLAWAGPRGLGAEDGLFLVEFGADGRTLKDATERLDGCGTPAKEVKAAVKRLLANGMIEPVPAPVEVAAPPRRRW